MNPRWKQILTNAWILTAAVIFGFLLMLLLRLVLRF